MSSWIKKITISGHLGSGKSAVGKILARQHELQYYSTGIIQREIAKEQGLTVLELNRIAEKSQDIDDRIDGFSKSLNNKDENFIIDSRLAWHFIIGAFKVFLKVDKQEAVRRIMKDNQRQSESYSTPEEALVAINSREKSEQKRYHKLYGVSLYDEKNYHLVVNTTKRSVEETASIITEHWNRFLKGETFYLVLD